MKSGGRFSFFFFFVSQLRRLAQICKSNEDEKITDILVLDRKGN